MTENVRKHYNIVVKGRVQGVGFRFSAKTIAQSLGIKGNIKNNYNGDVYIEAEGTETQLNQFINWCNKGPSHAAVTDVLIEESSIRGYRFFDIVH